MNNTIIMGKIVSSPQMVDLPFEGTVCKLLIKAVSSKSTKSDNIITVYMWQGISVAIYELLPINSYIMIRGRLQQFNHTYIIIGETIDFIK